jgi:hypothetical protein
VAAPLNLDGTVDALLHADEDSDPIIYFNHIGANANGKDHVWLLGAIPLAMKTRQAVVILSRPMSSHSIIDYIRS